MTPRILTLFASLVLAVALAVPAGAQTKYQRWSNPDGPENQSKLLEELRSLVDQADRDRAADPQFLRDLRALLRKYDRPNLAQLLFDDSADGDFEYNPRWRVVNGKFWVERGYGLRSHVSRHQAAAQDQRTKKQRKQDQASKILGALLGAPPQQQQQQQSAGGDATAVIYSTARISNAFSMRVEMSSWEAHGRFEIGVYQGTRLNTGYRLIYAAGATPTLRLLRVSARTGASIVATASQRIILEDQKQHVIEWKRGPRGGMRILIDGTEMIHARDTGYRDPFDGVTLLNRSGDFIVSKVLVDGTR